jgi:hypothetical protein
MQFLTSEASPLPDVRKKLLAVPAGQRNKAFMLEVLPEMIQSGWVRLRRFESQLVVDAQSRDDAMKADGLVMGIAPSLSTIVANIGGQPFSASGSDVATEGLTALFKGAGMNTTAVRKVALTMWKHPKDYMGETYEDYYVGPSRTRDSEALENSNFDVALKELGGEGDGVVVANAGHWAVGWVETILVHKDATEKVALLEGIEDRLAGYPVLDEEDYSNRQAEEARQSWESFGLREMIDATVSELRKAVSPDFLQRFEDVMDLTEWVESEVDAQNNPILWDYLYDAFISAYEESGGDSLSDAFGKVNESYMKTVLKDMEDALQQKTSPEAIPENPDQLKLPGIASRKMAWLSKDAGNMNGNGRWTYDPGAIPSEPSYYLDVPGDDLEAAKCVVVEQEQSVGHSTYFLMGNNGEFLGEYPYPEDAMKAAEEQFPLGGTVTSSLKVMAEGMDEEKLLKELATSLSADEVTLGKTDTEGGTFDADGVSYRFFWNEDKFETAAINQVTEDLENEPELFNQDWLQSHISISDTDKRIIAQEEADNLVDDAYDADTLVEKADMVNEYAKAQESGLDAKIGKVVDDAREAVRESEYERIKEELDDPIQYFVNDQGIYSIEDLMKAQFITINIAEAAREAVNTDGAAHFLSHYDGNYDTTASGVVYFQES